MVINSDNTQKSGVERQFGESGGKAWYVIVQSLDANDAPVKLRIKSVETGREGSSSLFGVRVDKERYEHVKRDKLDDGIINDKLVGVKPVGQLSFAFEPGFSAEYIMEW